MPRLVGEDADHLTDIVGFQEHAGVEEDRGAAGIKGVERPVVDDHEMHRFRRHAGGNEDRAHDLVEEILHLRIAQGADVLRQGRPHAEQEHEQGDEQAPPHKCHSFASVRRHHSLPEASRGGSACDGGPILCLG